MLNRKHIAYLKHTLLKLFTNYPFLSLVPCMPTDISTTAAKLSCLTTLICSCPLRNPFLKVSYVIYGPPLLMTLQHPLPLHFYHPRPHHLKLNTTLTLTISRISVSDSMKKWLRHYRKVGNTKYLIWKTKVAKVLA